MTTSVNTSSALPLALKEDDSYKAYCKASLPCSLVAMLFWEISNEILTASPASVVWVTSKACLIAAALCVIKAGVNLTLVGSPSLRTRNVQKLVATQEEVNSLRAEISRLQQELAARRGLAPVGTGSVPHSQSIAGAADTSVSQHVPHEPGPFDQRPHFITSP